MEFLENTCSRQSSNYRIIIPLPSSYEIDPMKKLKLCCFKTLVIFAALFSCSFSTFGFAQGSQNTKVIRIGYTQGIDPLVEQESIAPTVNYLKKHNPEYSFELIQISSVDTVEDIKRSNLNFLFAPSNFYIEISEEIPITHIVTRRTLKGDNPSNNRQRFHCQG